MKAAFVIFDGMTALDFIGVYDPLGRLRTMGFLSEFEWSVCALTDVVHDDRGLRFQPDRVGESLAHRLRNRRIGELPAVSCVRWC